jgi:D-xylose transport system substrate-binding protein
MTIYKPIKPLAYSAVESALKLARGEKIDAPDKINNLKLDVPSILQVPISVDKDNMMQTVIKDGYHPMEEVYKNVPKDQWPKAAANSRSPGHGAMFATIGLFLLGFVLVRAYRQ